MECRTTGGKPTLATYEYASSLLHSAIESAKTGSPIDLHANASKGVRPKYEGKVYMVGDNPRSDIAGKSRTSFSVSISSSEVLIVLYDDVRSEQLWMGKYFGQDWSFQR